MSETRLQNVLPQGLTAVKWPFWLAGGSLPAGLLGSLGRPGLDANTAVLLSPSPLDPVLGRDPLSQATASDIPSALQFMSVCQ